MVASSRGSQVRLDSPERGFKEDVDGYDRGRSKFTHAAKARDCWRQVLPHQGWQFAPAQGVPRVARESVGDHVWWRWIDAHSHNRLRKRTLCPYFTRLGTLFFLAHKHHRAGSARLSKRFPTLFPYPFLIIGRFGRFNESCSLGKNN